MVPIGLKIFYPQIFYEGFHGSVGEVAKETINEYKNIIGSYLPLIGLEIILFYFFRIGLQNYLSIKGQIVQLKLRMNLCQFVESYIDFVNNKDKGDKGQRKLEKFESLIFSNLVVNPDSIPITLDGIDQIAKTIKEIKN